MMVSVSRNTVTSLHAPLEWNVPEGEHYLDHLQYTYISNNLISYECIACNFHSSLKPLNE